MRTQRGLPFEDRYIPEPNTGCWLWLQHVGANGYGQIWQSYRKASAHRRSWEIHCSEIPDGLQVLHKCDTRSCVNPEHLYLGDRFDNAEDRIIRGRCNAPKGEAVKSAKLKPADVIAIRADPRPSTQIAKSYGLHPVSIRDIKRRINWAHIP